MDHYKECAYCNRAIRDGDKFVFKEGYDLHEECLKKEPELIEKRNKEKEEVEEKMKKTPKHERGYNVDPFRYATAKQMDLLKKLTGERPPSSISSTEADKRIKQFFKNRESTSK